MKTRLGRFVHPMGVLVYPDIAGANGQSVASLAASWARMWTPVCSWVAWTVLLGSPFAVWQTYAVLSGANAMVLGFTVFKVVFGVLQPLPVDRRSTDIHFSHSK